MNLTISGYAFDVEMMFPTDKPNKNGRIYPPEAMIRAVEHYKEMTIIGYRLRKERRIKINKLYGKENNRKEKEGN